MLTQKLVNKHLWYDPKTGNLWWKIRASGRRMNRPAGTIEPQGYVAVGLLGKVYKGHRLIWLMKTGAWPKAEIDHKDLNRANNKWNNLREADRGQNRRNSTKYKNNTSGYKGVSWHPQHKKWYAQLQCNKVNVFLGLFTSKKQAHDAYVAAAKKYFGEFARAG